MADLWRRHTFRCQPRIYLPCGCLEFFLDFLRRTRSCVGPNGLQLSGVLQRLQSGRRNEGSRKEYSSSNISIDLRYRDSLFSDANQHFGRGPLARSAEFRFRRELVCGTNVWNALGYFRDRADLSFGIRVDFFSHAWILAGAICRGVRWKFLFGFRASASYKALSAYFSISLGCSIDLHLLVFQSFLGNPRHPGDALPHPICWPGCWTAIASPALESRALAFSNGKLDFPRGYHYEIGGRFGQPGPGVSLGGMEDGYGPS